MGQFQTTAIASAFAAGAAALLAGQAQAVPTDLELQLLVDVSGSVDTGEFNLQRSGYSSAFRSDPIQDAILSTADGDFGNIAAELIYWSGSTAQSVGVDWSLLDSASAIDGFADDIDAAVRPFSGNTHPDDAIDFGTPLFDTNGFEGSSLVMDVSGDGTGSEIDTAAARDAALAGGIDRINGLAIGDQDILDFYEDNIVGGSGSFALLVNDFDEFEDGVARKLQAEITGGPPPGMSPIPLPAAGWLLLGGLGGIASLARRKRASAA